MHYVYIIQSIKFKNLYKRYSTNLQKRLKDHNSGKNKHTTQYKPWKIIYYSVFSEKNIALNFEKYLKTGSGIAFMRKRLIKYKKC